MARVVRHIREGFLGVFRHFALSLSSISSVTVTLMIMSLFLIIGANISQITQDIEQSVQIHVQVEEEFSEENQLNEIEDKIWTLANVKDVEFSSKDDELEYYIESDSSEDSEELFGGFRGENNPMMNAFLVTVYSGDKIKEVTEEIREIEGVHKALYGGDGAANLLSNMENIRNVGFIIVAFLAIIAIFLISNTIRVSIHSRQKEIGIMRTVGATNWYIRWPFIIEGMIIGLIGSILPIVVTVFSYRYLLKKSQGFILSQMFQLLPSSPLILYVSIALALIGTIVGAIGSMFSVGKFLRWTR